MPQDDSGWSEEAAQLVDGLEGRLKRLETLEGGGGGGCLQLIDSAFVLNGSPLTLTIPASSEFSNLQLMWNAKSRKADDTDDLMMRIDGNSAAVYTYAWGWVAGGAPGGWTANALSGQTSAYIGRVAAANATESQCAGSGYLNFMGINTHLYADSHLHHYLQWAGVYTEVHDPNWALVAAVETGHVGGAYCVAQNKVDSVTLFMSSGQNFDGVAWLYGFCDPTVPA